MTFEREIRYLILTLNAREIWLIVVEQVPVSIPLMVLPLLESWWKAWMSVGGDGVLENPVEALETQLSAISAPWRGSFSGYIKRRGRRHLQEYIDDGSNWEDWHKLVTEEYSNYYSYIRLSHEHSALYLIGWPVFSSNNCSSSDIASSLSSSGEAASEISGVCVWMPNFSFRSLTVHRCGLK